MWPRLRHPWTGALAPSRKVAIGAATLVALTLVSGVQYLPVRLQLREGQVSPRDVTAPRTVEFVDRARTEALRRAAAESIQPVYRQSAGETARAHEVIGQTAAAIERARRVSGLSYAERRALLSRESPIPLDDPAALAALTVDAAALVLARTTAERLVATVMDAGIKPEDLPKVQMQARVSIRALQLAGRPMTLASALVLGVLTPNVTVDVGETQRLHRRAMEGVEPVTTRILRGEIVVRRGEVVTEAHVQKLAALGLVRAPFSWQRPLGVALILVLMVVVSFAYLRQYQPEIWAEDRLLMVWSLAVVLTLGLNGRRCRPDRRAAATAVGIVHSGGDRHAGGHSRWRRRPAWAGDVHRLIRGGVRDQAHRPPHRSDACRGVGGRGKRGVRPGPQPDGSNAMVSRHRHGRDLRFRQWGHRRNHRHRHAAVPGATLWARDADQVAGAQQPQPPAAAAAAGRSRGHLSPQSDRRQPGRGRRRGDWRRQPPGPRRCLLS
ncbi:MAG: hypothetical protein E6H01_05875 [Bacillati bacterium ANGP1]|uniref:Metal-dependent phosphohydrolase 7TM extracellular domain-containing protein n=1 Tax=Candidatus Segetimicrobium genomatis TaxID=2569760 RepID=A0A537L4W2_9BACT|nr:MAG: hypothetical protein E6H01_05875 [Terrabacteria group bacterium ANGP1]